jgi:hypothetical protein
MVLRFAFISNTKKQQRWKVIKTQDQSKTFLVVVN